MGGGTVRAILHIFVETNSLERVAEAINRIPESLDVYEVTGEFDIIAMVDVHSIEELRELMRDKILKIPGIKSTVTSIVLHTYKKAGAETGE